MDFTEIMKLLKNASPYDLYRIKVAINNEIEKPENIKIMRTSFAVGDQISYFDEQSNSLISAIVLDKMVKNVRVRNLVDQKIWIFPYYMLNLEKKESNIHINHKEKPTKNHFRIGDCVGFDNDGKQCIGTITKLNHKTASLVTSDNKRWRVSYGLLFQVFDAESEKMRLLINHSGNIIEIGEN
ncbi:MAG: hypothetical protein A3F10_07550 [Coxiella sp. RIFCSPHIGHO2_12_FULL_42_15]|nr:MAG: hypothetical protein A3F10_07550 [Coxiella sp. RIFCSPHIGHO2_12_FULL_42_15]